MTALRARALCSGCESRLPPRTDAWWDEASRTATCLSCARAMGLLEVPTPPLVPPAPAPAGPVSEPAPEAPPAIEPEPVAVEPVAVEPDQPAGPIEQAGPIAPVDDGGATGGDEDPSDDGGLPVRTGLSNRGVVRPLRASVRPAPGTSGTVIRRRAVDPGVDPGVDPSTESAADRGATAAADDGPPSGAAVDRRPPLPPREQVTALRPSRKPTAETGGARRFPSEGATAIEAEAEDDPVGDDATADGSDATPATPPLRRAAALPPDDADEEAVDGGDADDHDAEPEPRHVQSAADLIGRLRAVQRTTTQPAPRRGPLVVERPEAVADRGEIDDTRVTQTLEAARIHGVEVLHHRPVTADRTVDHLVIAVNGIWTVVEQEKLTGPLDKRDLGDWFTADARLFIGDEDRTDLIESARAQAEAVRRLLADGPFATVPVRPVVCFGTVPPGWVREPFVVGGVSVTWRNHLVEPMLDPVLLDREARHQLIGLLVAAGT